MGPEKVRIETQFGSSIPSMRLARFMCLEASCGFTAEFLASWEGFSPQRPCPMCRVGSWVEITVHPEEPEHG